jgi:hypothetical protein
LARRPRTKRWSERRFKYLSLRVDRLPQSEIGDQALGAADDGAGEVEMGAAPAALGRAQIGAAIKQLVLDATEPRVAIGIGVRPGQADRRIRKQGDRAAPGGRSECRRDDLILGILLRHG